MGLLGKLFGGGTALEVSLSSSKVVAGGVVAGKVTVTGGKRPLTMTSLIVSVAHAHVSDNDSPIELRQLVQTTVVANQALPPGKVQSFDFTAQLPDGLDPKGSYKVIAHADIPGVKDPSAEAGFKVIRPGAKRGTVGAMLGSLESEVLARYPGLLSHDEDEVYSALWDLHDDANGEDASKLVSIAPWLLRFVKTGREDVRAEALETWSTLLNGRARPSDIEELAELALDAGQLRGELREALINAVTKFADEGAGSLLQRLAADPDPEVRSQVACSLRRDAADDLPGRFELVASLTRDGDASVRRAAASALAPFADNRTAMQLGVDLASNDPSPEVRVAAINAIACSHHHGMLELVLDTYRALLSSPSSEVRMALAESLFSLPTDPRVGSLVEALLVDRSSEVRKCMVESGVNLSEYPSLAPTFQQVAEHDPDDEVRAEAVYGMHGFLEPAQAVAYARARLAADPTEHMARRVFHVACAHDDEPSARAFLGELARSQFSDVASSAREALSEATLDTPASQEWS